MLWCCDTHRELGLPCACLLDVEHEHVPTKSKVLSSYSSIIILPRVTLINPKQRSGQDAIGLKNTRILGFVPRIIGTLYRHLRYSDWSKWTISGSNLVSLTP